MSVLTLILIIKLTKKLLKIRSLILIIRIYTLLRSQLLKRLYTRLILIRIISIAITLILITILRKKDISYLYSRIISTCIDLLIIFKIIYFLKKVI